MPDKETLQKIIADPHSSEEERAEARRLLKTEPSPPTESQLKMTGIRCIAEPERSLLQFAGVTALEDVTTANAMRFADQQLQPMPENVLKLLGLWRCLRIRPTDEVWQELKGRFESDEQRRTEFSRIVESYPFIRPHEATSWDEFHHLEQICAQRDVNTVRAYFLPQIEALLERLPEYAFEIREAVQTLLNQYKPNTETKNA